MPPFPVTSASGQAEQVVQTNGSIGQLTVQPGNLTYGTGSPAGVVVGSPGDLYLNLSGGAGTTLFVKESGVGTNTGWVGK